VGATPALLNRAHNERVPGGIRSVVEVERRTGWSGNGIGDR